MLDQEDELHLLGFLATLGGLLGIVVGVSQFQVGSASSSTVRAYFSLLLVVFLFAAALAYLGALQDRDVASFNLAVLGYSSALVGFAVGLAAASLLPVDVQFGGFWVIAIIAALSFSTGHCNAGTVSSIGARVLALGGSGVGGFARPGIRVFHWRHTHGLWRFVLSPTFVSRWRHGSEMPDSTFGSRSRFSVAERTLSARAERA